MLKLTDRFLAYRYLALTAAAVALLATAAPARAGQADATVTAKVHYSDLDLDGSAGEAALKARIQRAAIKVCGEADGRTVADYGRVATCRANAIADASPKMNAVIASVRSDHRYAMNDDTIAVRGR